MVSVSKVIVTAATVAGVFYAENTFAGVAALHGGNGLLRGFMYLAATGCGLIVSNLLSSSSSSSSRVGSVTGLLSNKDQVLSKDQVQKHVDAYQSMFGDKPREAADSRLVKRLENYTTMVNNFYDLVTDFYEYGWGDSFHFAQRYKDETHMESIRRAEHYLAARGHISANMVVADIGCGVGGPMRAIAKFSGARVMGINNNDYQIKVGTRHNINQNLEKQCGFIKCDFQHIPVSDNHFDGAFSIEAMCHSPDRAQLYKEIKRILKPGAYMAVYDWVMTDKYDANNKKHVEYREAIEWGNSLPRLNTVPQVLAAYKEAGLEVVDHFDPVKNGESSQEIPWYQPLDGSYTSLDGFRKTPLGRSLTNIMCWTLETLRIAPKGTTYVATLLSATAEDLVAAGKSGIFSPDYFFLVRKPLDA